MYGQEMRSWSMRKGGKTKRCDGKVRGVAGSERRAEWDVIGCMNCHGPEGRRTGNQDWKWERKGKTSRQTGW